MCSCFLVKCHFVSKCSVDMGLKFFLFVLLVAAVSSAALVGKFDKNDVEKEAPIEEKETNDVEMDENDKEMGDDAGDMEDEVGDIERDDFVMDDDVGEMERGGEMEREDNDPKTKKYPDKVCLAHARTAVKGLINLNKKYMKLGSKFIILLKPKTRKDMVEWATHMTRYYKYIKNNDKYLVPCVKLNKYIKNAGWQVAYLKKSSIMERKLANMTCPNLAVVVIKGIAGLNKYYMKIAEQFVKKKFTNATKGMQEVLRHIVPYWTMLHTKSPATSACINKYLAKTTTKPWTKKPAKPTARRRQLVKMVFMRYFLRKIFRRQLVKMAFIRYFLRKIFRLAIARSAIARALRFDYFILRFSNPILYSILMKKAALGSLNRAIAKNSLLLRLVKAGKFKRVYRKRVYRKGPKILPSSTFFPKKNRFVQGWSVKAGKFASRKGVYRKRPKNLPSIFLPK